MIGFEFLRPGQAWWMLAGALALFVGLLALARSRRELALFVSERQLARFVPGFSGQRARLRVLLGAAALALLALAAAGPVRGYTYRAVSRKGLDLVLCLDTSRSMLAQDLRPSRLERAKREVLGLLDHLKGDRVALVAFSGDARDVAPLTRDRTTLAGLLGFVTPDDNQKGGTNLAAAIERALSLFDGRTGAHEAVVLLTDGEDLEGRGAELAQEAAQRKIRIYVVGFGTEAGGKIPVVDSDGRQSFLRDPDGKEVVTKLDRTSLVALARVTGGDFLSAEESPTPLEDLHRSRIGRIEGREVEGGERRVPYDRFQWPLALALACLLAEIAVRERAPRRARASGSPRLAAALLPLCLLGGDQGRFRRSLENAVQRRQAGELEAAEQAARSLLEQADELELDDPQRAEAHFALGVVCAVRALEPKPAGQEPRPDWQDATEAFSATRARAGPGELRLAATYDLGAVQLFQAEAKRAEIPEIRAQMAQAPALPGLPGAPGSTPVPGAAPDAKQDPLKEARAFYLAAKDWFLERLRGDWHDADTRGNLELVQRRLHELEQIEEQRKQQQQEQKDQQKQQNPDQQDQDQKEDQEKKDQEKKEQEKKDQQDGGKDGDPKDGKQQPKDPKEPKDPPKDGEQEQDEPKDGEQPPQPEEGPQAGQEQESDAGKPPAERVLTREEVMQLLDKLAQLEKQQKALDAALRARGRAAVKRDW